MSSLPSSQVPAAAPIVAIFTQFSMPPQKLKPSDLAADVKKVYVEHIRKSHPEWPCESHLIEDTDSIMCGPVKEKVNCGIRKGSHPILQAISS